LPLAGHRVPGGRPVLEADRHPADQLGHRLQGDQDRGRALASSRCRAVPLTIAASCSSGSGAPAGSEAVAGMGPILARTEGRRRRVPARGRRHHLFPTAACKHGAMRDPMTTPTDCGMPAVRKTAVLTTHGRLTFGRGPGRASSE
jgi:hypothetical protein